MTQNVTPNVTQSEEYSWTFFTNIAREYKSTLILANIVALFAILVTLPIPLLLPLLVDEVLLNKPGALVALMDQLFPLNWQGAVLYITLISLVTIILRVTGIFLSVLQTRQFTLLAKDVVFRIRQSLLSRLQLISMKEYETLGSGAVASHFVTDLNAIDEFIGASISKTLVAMLSLIGITGILLWIHWQLALFILFMNPIVIYFTVVLGKKVKHLKKKENHAFEIFQESLIETLDAVQQIRASNREEHFYNQVTIQAEKIKNYSSSFSWKSDAANRFSFGIFLIGFDSFRAISMLMVVFSDLSVGEMMAVFGYLWFMMGPVQELLNLQYAYYSAKAALTRINKLLSLDQEALYPHLKNPFQNKTTVSIQIKNINFSYLENAPVLNNVSLNIKSGEKIALVGASGGGKSTLVQVLLGMYSASSGDLCFDNVSVSEIGLDVVRENVATVLQHPAMFNDSVRNNLTLGAEFSDNQLWQALEIAQLKAKIESLPEQLDTRIGKHGLRLSGGQLQRLAIARLILADPKVVILDEATSSLDSRTEKQLHKALKLFLNNRTTIIIAHRLSAVRQADRVYVFEDGHIIEEGEHEELIQNNGLYKKLYDHS